MRIDGQTDGHDESDSRFSKFCERAKKLQCLICVINFLQIALKFVVCLVLEEMCPHRSVMLKWVLKFNVLLTVHHAMILGNCPTWRTNSFQCIYLFIVLYMFGACHAHHQKKQIVSIQLLVIVTPCWWPCRVLVGSKLPTSTRHGQESLHDARSTKR